MTCLPSTCLTGTTVQVGNNSSVNLPFEKSSLAIPTRVTKICLVFGFPFLFLRFWGFVVFVFLCHLQAAELGAHAGDHAPSAAGAQSDHQLALHLRAVGARGAQLCVVDADGDDVARARTLTRARLVVPAGGEVRRDVVDTIEHGTISRRLGRRSSHGLRSSSLSLLGEGLQPGALVVLIGSVADRRERRDGLRRSNRRRLILWDEVHADDRNLPVGNRILDRPELGRLEGLEEEMLGDLGPVEPVVKVARLLLAPLLVVLAVPHNSVALRTIRTGALRDETNWEVLPDVLAQPELWDVVVPAVLELADGLLLLGRDALGLKVRRRNVVHTEVTPADGMRVHQRVEMLHRQMVEVCDGGHF